MNRKIILLFILIIALGVFTWSYFSNSITIEDGDSNAFIFDCPSGAEIKISYDEESDSAILFVEGEEYKIRRVISASGARYANDDETVVFWEHQGEAMVEIDGKIMYQECKLK